MPTSSLLPSDNELAGEASQDLIEKSDSLVALGQDATGEALFSATYSGNAAEVASLLAAGAPIESCFRPHITPLMQASECGHTQVIEVLLAAGANIEASDDDGDWTPLCYAAAFGCVEAARTLLAAGANVDGLKGPWRFETTPLRLAAENGCLEVVDILLAAGANVAIADLYVRTPLFFAAVHGFVGVVASLLAAGSYVDACSDEHETPLMMAASFGHVEIVELLLAAGANIESVDNFGMLPLGLAAKHDQVDVLCVLIRAGAKLDTEQRYNGSLCTPLYIAIEMCHDEIVRELLAAGADPDTGKYGYKQQPDGSKTKSGLEETPLMKAAYRKSVDIVRMLLEGGARNVNFVGRGGWTALMNGAEKKSPELVKLLLTAGANPFAQLDFDSFHSPNWMGKRALDLADGETKELLKREMDRLIAAALSLMPAEVSMHFKKYILTLTYPGYRLE